VLGGLLLLGTALPVVARVSFLPARSMPVLLMMDADLLQGHRTEELASMGYVLERDLLPDCSATEYGLLMLRLQLAPRIVAVLDADDHALVLQALHDAQATVEFNAAFSSDAALEHPLLGPLRRLLFAQGAPAALQALVARRSELI
jgi:hypothetical protein